MARGINFAIALEGALKMKELAYIHAEGMPAGEFKHGPLALVDERTAIIAINPRDETHSAMLNNIHEAKARGAHIVGLSDVNNEVYDVFLPLPRVESLFYPLVSAIPLQLLAYNAALQRGCPIDQPRNIAKTVTTK